jgi:hypothetical protein
MTKRELKAFDLEGRKEYILEMLDKKTHNFSMFSKAGGKRVKSLLKRCIKKVMNKKAIRQKEFEKYVCLAVKKVGANEKYEEIGDTAVREVIFWWLELAIEMADYDWSYDFDYQFADR